MYRFESITGRFYCAAGLLLVLATVGFADEFGSDGNAFTMDFVDISAETNPLEGELGHVAQDYRIGVYEVTQDQWSKYQAAQGNTVEGGLEPVRNVTWYQAAAFANWLNEDQGKQVAYDLAPGLDSVAQWTIDGQEYLRHPDAFYFLPSLDEWVKAAYWNGSEVQTYANRSESDLEDGRPIIGDGTGLGWNYGNYIAAFDAWEVGSGSEELNGTFDMMGNVAELTESDSTYFSAYKSVRGGSNFTGYGPLASTYEDFLSPSSAMTTVGFRVGSVPEPASLALLLLGGGALLRKRRLSPR